MEKIPTPIIFPTLGKKSDRALVIPQVKRSRVKVFTLRKWSSINPGGVPCHLPCPLRVIILLDGLHDPRYLQLAGYQKKYRCIAGSFR